MIVESVGNRDRCGKCGIRHGGNNHFCAVHGGVSAGCCATSCNPSDYVTVGTTNKDYPSLAPKFETKLRAGVDLSNAELDPPYMHQNDGQGGYKPGYIERFIING